MCTRGIVKVKINIKCLVPIPDNKIRVIKLLRKAFLIGLKDAKDLADKFHSVDTIVYESARNLSIKKLNKEYSKDGPNVRVVEYSVHGKRTNNGFCTEDFLEKIKFFASLALDNDEAMLAEDLLHVYNKHLEE